MDTQHNTTNVGGSLPNIEPTFDWMPDDEFRNTLSTVNEKGKRIWLYPKQSEGLFTVRREYVAYFLIALWVAGPWMTWNGQPFMLFNVIERHFIILGFHFFPQDLVYFGILLLTFFLFIAVFTLTYGRVWCGWACPQTLFMEHVFRKFEYFIEGSHKQQQALSKQGFTLEKIARRGTKYVVYYLFSAGIGLLVMCYVLGRPEVSTWLSTALFSNLKYFMFWAVFSTIFFLVFSWAREQVCIAMCPYGRLQSVLLNNHSLLVIYNALRGEPRKERGNKNAANFSGDCIDCALCVQVCPTGIDIRNGTQLECVNCTACIDACDFVMDKVNKPRGLISLNTHDNIQKGKAFWTPTLRTWVTTAIMVILLGTDVVILANRKPMNITLLRVPGQLYQIDKEKGTISNLYNLQLVNKTTEFKKVTVTIPGADVKLVAGKLEMPAQGYVDVTLFITLPKESVKHGKNTLTATFTDNSGNVFEKTTSFLAP